VVALRIPHDDQWGMEEELSLAAEATERERSSSSFSIDNPLPPSPFPSPPPPHYVLSLSPIYTRVAFSFSLLCPALSLAYAITLDNSPLLLLLILSPFILVAFTLCLMIRPRDDSPSHYKFIHLQFATLSAIPELCFIIGDLRSGSYGSLFRAPFRISLFLVLYQGCHQVRTIISEMPDPALHSFLRTNVVATLASMFPPMLYMAFVSVKCTINTRSFEDPVCVSTSVCQVFLSSYIFAGHFIRMSYACISSQSRHPLTIQQIVTFSNLQTRNKVQCILIAITAVCALYLFAHLESPPVSSYVIFAVGTLGGTSLFITFVWEAWSLTRSRKKFMRRPTEQGLATSGAAEGSSRTSAAFSSAGLSRSDSSRSDSSRSVSSRAVVVVVAASPVYANTAYCLTALTALNYAAYAITLRLSFFIYARLLVPIVGEFDP